MSSKTPRGTDEVMLNWGPHHYKLNKSAATFVADAIRQEIERNGHKCVSTSALSNSDFIIDGIVYKYWLHWDGAFTTNTIANVKIQLTVSTSSDIDKRNYSKNYEGEYRFEGDYSYNGGYDYSGNLFADILEQALMRMVGEISTDSELIAFIENK